MLNIDGVSSMLYYTSPYSISGAARGDSEQGDGARARPGGLPACLPPGSWCVVSEALTDGRINYPVQLALNCGKSQRRQRCVGTWIKEKRQNAKKTA